MNASTLRRSQRGVALVITLILLAVITFMAVTFLVVSHTEKGSVTNQTDLSMARLAADTARDRAIAEMLAPMMATNNLFNYGLLVSTNYINLNGYDPTVVGGNLLNVNYDYCTTPPGGPLTLADRLQNLQNLFWNPRPPVFIVTNAFATVSNDFRFYIDLNRNGLFDPTGFMPLTNAQNKQIVGSLAFLVGDPQWIGILQHPELFHSPTNIFTSRFAYFVVPVGQTLDINTIHNFAKHLNGGMMNKAGDGFSRDQGILPAEINLAAFLADLNTNFWPVTQYYYDTNYPPRFNSGTAFDDAYALLRYRYGFSSLNLAKVPSLFGPPGANAFTPDLMDGYSGGPVMLGVWWPPPGSGIINQTRVSNWPWAGADSPNRFYSAEDLFDTDSKIRANTPWIAPNTPDFADRLRMAGTNNDSYDRYTFNRLLAQLGTDSTPAPQDKMNLNYCNVTNGYVAPGMETNFYAWQPIQFFTNAAIRLMVDAGYTVGASTSTSNLLVTNIIAGVLVTNLQIPIWPTNYYTPSLHRLLQLAVNLYDATTNRTDANYPTTYPYLPTVFRPVFRSAATSPKGGSGGIAIIGYQEVTPADTPAFLSTVVGTRPHDLSDPTDLAVKPLDMVYNIPLVIGAKKGLPSFDELSMDTQIQAARKLIFHRQGLSTTAAVNEMDPEYVLTITNVVGLQAWNSYAANYTRAVTLEAWPDTSLFITNVDTGALLNPPGYPNRQPTIASPLIYSFWPGYNATFPGSSFITPLGPGGSPYTNYVFMPTNSVYSFSGQSFVVNGNPDRTPGTTNYHVPHFQVTLKARLRFVMVDQVTQRLIDYVNLATNQTVDVTSSLMGGGCGTNYSASWSKDAMWCTNLMTGVKGADPNLSFGAQLQLDVSGGSALNQGSVDWTSSLPDPLYGQDKDKGIARFLTQFGLGLSGVYPTYNTFAAPYQPFRNVHLVTLWQANDPLVHYTVGDLQNTTAFPQSVYLDQLPTSASLPPTAFGTVNNRYEPWGGNPASGSGSATKWMWQVKDPVPAVYATSDYWDFPTNRFPNPGWVGRVHRGSPWQTVYLKPPDTNAWNSYWPAWTGNPQVVTNLGQLSTNMIIPRSAVANPQLLATNASLFFTFSNGLPIYDSYLSQPVNDGHLLDLFSTAFDASATRGRLSINQTNLAAWSAVLSGVIALTNSGGSTGVSPLVIQPAGAYDPTVPVNTLPAVVQIVNAINAIRATFPNGAFQRLGDLLSVPQLTVASPFLNLNTSSPPTYPPISDAAMERIPQQILGLLKLDSVPRFVIYSYGQTLKPANHSRMTSGSFFGLVTNYQITAEVATRTLVRFDGAQPAQFGVPQPINTLHPVIESFNVLPPD